MPMLARSCRLWVAPRQNCWKDVGRVVFSVMLYSSSLKDVPVFRVVSDLLHTFLDHQRYT
jgi:hypothetical protein